jgi:hypothetical protein
MDKIPEWEGALIRTGPHSAVNKHMSPEKNRGGVRGSQNPSKESQLHANPHTQGSSNMVSSIYS